MKQAEQSNRPASLMLCIAQPLPQAGEGGCHCKEQGFPASESELLLQGCVSRRERKGGSNTTGHLSTYAQRDGIISRKQAVFP